MYKTLGETLTKTKLNRLVHNDMVRGMGHYNDVEYDPSTTNDPPSEIEGTK